jgi:replication factor A1
MTLEAHLPPSPVRPYILNPRYRDHPTEVGKMDNDEVIAPHIDDITRVLGNKVEKEVIAKELAEYLNVYRVPLGIAKESIVRKHGGNPKALAASVFRKLAELRVDEPSVDLLVRVVTVNRKTVETDSGSKEIVYGIFGDDTRTVQFTAWDASRFPFERGDVLRVVSAYTKGWRDEVQVNLGDRSAVTKESPDALPPVQGAAPQVQSAGIVKVKDFRPGLRGLDVAFRVLSVGPRKVTVKGEERTVWGGSLADETGRADYSSWHDFDLKPGDVVRLRGGYIRTWRGVPQLSFDSRDAIDRLPDDALPPAGELDVESVISIEELERRGGAPSVAIQGTIIEVREGSGLVFRCPECRRVARKGVCAIHGRVEAIPDLRTKAVIDDGTGSLSVVIGRELTEELLGKTLEQCKALAQEAFDAEVVRDIIADRLIARPVRVAGNVLSDDFGLMMICSRISDVEVDVRAEARATLERMGVE